ncbi:MAG TPA: tyrosine--tRNA ligase [Anaerolineales bacterium]|nr:tyrosine--tRNA ligase [Anaerolineales bacterium]
MTLDDQVALLMQGTEYGDDAIKHTMARELRARLAEGRPLRVYCGYDPTSTDLHLGHTVTMRKLRQFQDLGHEVTFLIGSYTALVGDPSDKNKARPILSEEQVAANAKTYTEQAFRILDPQKTKVRYNGEWLAELSLLDLIKLGQNFTLQQFMARENFAKRLDSQEPIYLQETFYPLMQGYDAVALKTDVQVGGTDQLFNIVVAGRKLQEALGQKPLVGVILGILPGTDGTAKMSKSMGNHIAILATPEDMYGKVMSIPDQAMPAYFRLITRYTPDQLAAVERGLADGSRHPRDTKMELAREIVSIYHGDAAVAPAEEHFKTIFQKGALPADIPTVMLADAPLLVEFIVAQKLAASKGEVRRLIEQGGVKVDGQTVTDITARLEVTAEAVVQVGKRRFVKVVRG